MQLIGQKANLEIINAWKNLPQFLIIQGDRNTGKTKLTLYLCERFGLKYVKMNNSVNGIRELIKLMTPGSNTVYHFKDFDRASIQAKNALLKITEEPIDGNYIVITGNRQIATLESRAKKLVMNAYTFDEMSAYMQKYFSDKNMQLQIYNAGINTPSKVDMYGSYDAIHSLVSYAYEIFNKITNITMADCIITTSMFYSRYDDIDASYLFLTMLIHIIENNIQTHHLYSYYKILEVLISAKESIEKDKTLNRKFILYRTFYTLSNMRGSI